MFRNTITTITILAGCLLLASCRQGANPKGSGNGAERARVVVTRPERRNLSLEIARPGYVKAFEKTPLYAKLEGYVGKTRTVKNGSGKDVPGELADIGEPVKEGEILAEILVPELVEELNQDKALQIQAEAGVEQAAKSLLVAERKEESVLAQVAESKAGLIKTQGDYERWKAEYHRVNELAQGG